MKKRGANIRKFGNTERQEGHLFWVTIRQASTQDRKGKLMEKAGKKKQNNSKREKENSTEK